MAGLADEAAARQKSQPEEARGPPLISATLTDVITTRPRADNSL
jgi:hypothetical protein